MRARNIDAIDRSILLRAVAAYVAGSLILAAMLVSTLLWPVLSGF